MGQSGSVSNPTHPGDQEGLNNIHGFQISSVLSGSPAMNAGLIPYFDIITAADHVRLDQEEMSTEERVFQFQNCITGHVDIPIVLEVYNIKIRAAREVSCTPSRGWGGSSLLGCSILWKRADCLLLQNYIIGFRLAGERTTSMIDAAESFFESTMKEVEQRSSGGNSNISLLLYNAEDNIVSLAEVAVQDGRIGIAIAHGMLHLIPVSRSRGGGNLPVYKAEPMAVKEEAVATTDPPDGSSPLVLDDSCSMSHTQDALSLEQTSTAEATAPVIIDVRDGSASAERESEPAALPTTGDAFLSSFEAPEGSPACPAEGHCSTLGVEASLTDMDAANRFCFVPTEGIVVEPNVYKRIKVCRAALPSPLHFPLYADLTGLKQKHGIPTKKKSNKNTLHSSGNCFLLFLLLDLQFVFADSINKRCFAKLLKTIGVPTLSVALPSAAVTVRRWNTTEGKETPVKPEDPVKETPVKPEDLDEDVVIEPMPDATSAPGAGADAKSDATETEKVVGESEELGFKTETRQLLDIVACSLYSDKEVFIRELVSNASDALEKRHLMEISNPEYERSSDDENVRVYTRSCKKDSKGYLWESDGTGTYKISECEGVDKGTKIVLDVKDTELSFCTPQVVERVLKKYSNFVSYEITLNNGKVNTVEALWMKEKNDISNEEHIDFYKFISGSYDSPMIRLHYSIDAPMTVRALLYHKLQNIEMFDANLDGYVQHKLKELGDKTDAEVKKQLTETQVKALGDFISKRLVGRIGIVKSTTRLRDSPAVLVDHESAQMRKIYRMTGQAAGPPPKYNMQINPQHPLIRKMYTLSQSTENEEVETAGLLAEQVFDNAVISAGLLEDPRSLVSRLNAIMTRMVDKVEEPTADK
eukprot:gene8427-5906_t